MLQKPQVTAAQYAGGSGGTHPWIEQCLCKKVCTPADELPLEVPATHTPLVLIPCASHNITSALLLMSAKLIKLDTVYSEPSNFDSVIQVAG